VNFDGASRQMPFCTWVRHENPPALRTVRNAVCSCKISSCERSKPIDRDPLTGALPIWLRFIPWGSLKLHISYHRISHCLGNRQSPAVQPSRTSCCRCNRPILTPLPFVPKIGGFHSRRICLPRSSPRRLFVWNDERRPQSDKRTRIVKFPCSASSLVTPADFVMACQPCTIGFVNVPIPVIVIATESPACNVNSSGGTIPVPVNRNAPFGKMLSLPSQPMRSSNVRAI